MTTEIPDLEHRLTRLEVYAEVARNDQQGTKRSLEQIVERLDKIDKDINAAKVGGRIVWFIGGIVLSYFATYLIAHVVPYIPIPK